MNMAENSCFLYLLKYTGSLSTCSKGNEYREFIQLRNKRVRSYLNLKLEFHEYSSLFMYFGMATNIHSYGCIFQYHNNLQHNVWLDKVIVYVMPNSLFAFITLTRLVISL